MTFVTPSPLSTAAFVAIVLAVLSAFFAGVYWANRGRGRLTLWRTGAVAAGTFAWLAIVTVFCLSGDIERSPIPNLLILVALSNGFALVLGLSTVGRWLATLPLVALVGFQSFRFPLELVLHSWVDQGSIPATMTWTHLNWDIGSGVLALVAAPFVSRSRLLAWIVNGVGFFLLLNVMRVAVLSSPLPFAWQIGPPLQLAFHVPYVWILPVCVAGALLGHVVLTRALMSEKKSTS